MEAADLFMTKRDHMIDVIFDAFRNAPRPGLSVNGTDRVQIRPWWRGAPSGKRVTSTLIGPLIACGVAANFLGRTS